MLATELVFYVDPASPLARDMTKKQWRVESDEPFDAAEVRVVLVDILQPGEVSVPGEEMVERAIKLNANLTQRHAEALLKSQDQIPEVLRSTIYINFPGTIWRRADGCRYIPHLMYDGAEWKLYFHWLDHHWSSIDRLAQRIQDDG